MDMHLNCFLTKEKLFSQKTDLHWDWVESESHPGFYICYFADASDVFYNISLLIDYVAPGLSKQWEALRLSYNKKVESLLFEGELTEGYINASPINDSIRFLNSYLETLKIYCNFEKEFRISEEQALILNEKHQLADRWEEKSGKGYYTLWNRYGEILSLRDFMQFALDNNCELIF